MAEPMWRTIAHDLHAKINAGALPGGTRLPTEPELMAEYGASRNTIRDAMKWLNSRGLVTSRSGRGTFVTRPMEPFVINLTDNPQSGSGLGRGDIYSQDVLEQGRTPRMTKPVVEIKQATDVPIAARELRVGDDKQVICRSQERFIDETPWSLQTSYYSMDLFQRGAVQLIHAVPIEEGTSRYLHETLGLEQVGFQDQIKVRPADNFELRFFGLPDIGRSVFENFRTTFDASGTPIRFTKSTYPADRNYFLVSIGKVPDEIRLSRPGRRPNLDRSEPDGQRETYRVNPGPVS